MTEKVLVIKRETVRLEGGEIVMGPGQLWAACSDSDLKQNTVSVSSIKRRGRVFKGTYSFCRNRIDPAPESRKKPMARLACPTPRS